MRPALTLDRTRAANVIMYSLINIVNVCGDGSAVVPSVLPTAVSNVATSRLLSTLSRTDMMMTIWKGPSRLRILSKVLCDPEATEAPCPKGCNG